MYIEEINMPKHGGSNYYAVYFNSEGERNIRRNKGKLSKPTSADTLFFLEEVINKFQKKYGKKVKHIMVSKELKDMIDTRVKGKSFLKRIKLIVEKKADMGFRTVYLSELVEEIKL